MEYSALRIALLPAAPHVPKGIETDGPVPGRHSILSLGAAAFAEAGVEAGCFSADFEARPGLAPNPGTMEWRATQPEARARLPQGAAATGGGHGKICGLGLCPAGRPVFVAHPAAFDFPFVLDYLDEYVGKNPFGCAVINVRTYSMALLRRPYRASGKFAMPRAGIDPSPHTHIALDDAVEQGRLSCTRLRASRS